MVYSKTFFSENSEYSINIAANAIGKNIHFFSGVHKDTRLRIEKTFNTLGDN